MEKKIASELATELINDIQNDVYFDCKSVMLCKWYRHLIHNDNFTFGDYWELKKRLGMGC